MNERTVLAAMGENVMIHLETVKERMDVGRTMRASQVLATFVDPRHSRHARKWRYSETGASGNSNGINSDLSCLRRSSQADTFPQGSNIAEYRERNKREPNQAPERYFAGPTDVGVSKDEGATKKDRSSESSTDSTSTASSSASTASPPPMRVDNLDHEKIFPRAASLLRQALSLELGGGVMFLDTAAPSSWETGGYRTSPEMERNNPFDHGKLKPEDPKHNRQPSFTGSRSPESGLPTSPSDSEPFHASVLAFSPTMRRPQNIESISEIVHQQKIQMPVVELVKLVRRHPDGALYSPIDMGLDACTPETSRRRSRKKRSEEQEVRLLLQHFPDAQQLLFLPFWNSNLSRWTVCIAYTTSEYRRFSREIEYYFSVAFCNCVKAEIDRLVTVIADQQKTDFIGSVSHELRSPLHGILAACEILSETECSPFQKSLVEIAQSCAHTLLDTIDMVLDYSKINSFARNSQGAEQIVGTKPSVVQGGMEPFLNIYKSVNIVAITEEVVEGIATGHLSRKRSDNPSQINSGRTIDAAAHGISSPLGDNEHAQRPNVEIILDISPPSKWCFVTQPGAFRRIVMNLFGNALKYTEHGYIRVLLRFRDSDDDVPATDPKSSEGAPNEDHKVIVTLVVEDSGIGMSQEYLRTKVFTPFAQESAMAPGTGLGLSLVKNIVQMLEGEIHISSEKNVGTKVTVTLPMKQSALTTASQTVTGSMARTNDDAVTRLRGVEKRPHVVIYQEKLEGDSPQQGKGTQLMRQALDAYVSHWFEFPTVEGYSPAMEPRPDILCFDEVHLPEIEESFRGDEVSGPVWVVLCDNATRTPKLLRTIKHRKLEVISKPIGPHKLARVFVSALKKLEKGVTKQLAGAEEQSSDPQRREQEELDVSITGGGEEIEIRPVSPATILELNEAGQNRGDPLTSVPLPSITLAGATSEPTSSQQTQSAPSRPLHASRSDNNITTPDNSVISNPASASSRKPPRSKSDSRVPTIGSAGKGSARILLVDDNAVNLSLLKTFLGKRGYHTITLASDGAQAVREYEGALREGQGSQGGGEGPGGFDVVFMDLSMPVMDGFEATRQIRRIEGLYAQQQQRSHQQSLHQRRESVSTAHLSASTIFSTSTLAPSVAETNMGVASRPQLPPTPVQALTIALTGNASAKDQSEAFRSGLDLYMTKPVSFREVGKLLDLWERSGGRESKGRARLVVLSGAGEES